jgi:hypothetical protein
MTIGSTQRRTQERGHGQSLFILLLAPCNTPPACNVGGACSMAPANPPRDQATASWRKTSFQRRTPRAAVRHTHPSGRPPVTRTGDEPFRRRPSNQIPLARPAAPVAWWNPSGSVFSSHVQQQANRTKRSRPQSVLSHLNGGACRDRTDDPLLAKQVLSQLS